MGQIAFHWQAPRIGLESCRIAGVRIRRESAIVRMKRQVHGTEANDVAVGERYGSRHPCVAAERAVLAADILEEGAVLGYLDTGVTARERRRLEADVSGGVTADDVVPRPQAEAPASPDQ